MKRLKLLVPAMLLTVCMNAHADSGWLQTFATSATTTGSSYLTSKDKKLIIATQEDASSFVASDGQIHGPYLSAAMLEWRNASPTLQASDMQLAHAILARNALHEPGAQPSNTGTNGELMELLSSPGDLIE